MDEPNHEPREIHRDDLYRAVWLTPMSRLASEYGVSGNGLAKICDRLNVPYPPRGYWAKKAAGKQVYDAKLPTPGKGTPLSVTVTPTTIKSELSSKVLSDAQGKMLEALRVPEKLVRPHPVIAGWLERHQRRRQEARLERDPHRRQWRDPGNWSETDRRRHRILDVFFKKLELCGGTVEEVKREIVFRCQEESIVFQLRERTRKVRGQPQANHVGSLYRQFRHGFEPTGILAFSIRTYLPGDLRREWVETNKKKMEDFLPEIASTFVAAIPMLIDQTRARAEQQRQWRIADQKRFEEQQVRKLDDNRWRKFIQYAQQSRDAETVRIFLDRLKKAKYDSTDGQIGGKARGDWISWAENRLKKFDPICGGVDSIFEAINRVTAWDAN